MEPIPELTGLENSLARLQGAAQTRHRDWQAARKDKLDAEAFLELAPKAEELLEDLTSTLFAEYLGEIETTLTHAVQEVLGQDRRVTHWRDVQRGKLAVGFTIQQGGDEDHKEDILAGQGGSVANILSVGLRLIALSRLDPALHRPFLVLDEQDCWLKPELVPTFMKLIRKISEKLGIQVLVISHHPLDTFAGQAARVYRLRPGGEHGVAVELDKGDPVDDSGAPAEGGSAPSGGR